MKLIYLVLILITCQTAKAQLALTKRNRFGFSVSVGQSFNSTKSSVWQLERQWSKCYSYGFIYEYQHDTRLAFRSGFYFTRTQALLSDSPSDSTNLYYYGSDNFIRNSYDYRQLSSGSGIGFESPVFYQLLRRQYRFSSFMIPLEVVLHSKMKNFKRYYVKGGIHSFINYRTRATEESDFVNASGNADTDYRKAKVHDVTRFNQGLMLGAGGEYSFSGHSVVFIDFEICLPVRNMFRQSHDRAMLILGNGFSEQPELQDVLENNAFINNSLRQIQAQVRIGFLF